VQQLLNNLTTIAVAIIGLALVAALISRGGRGVEFVGQAGSSFSQALATALSPVTGGSTFGGFSGGKIGSMY
jgi:ABC-type proline/glycine betaine transport system permease subunit